MLKRLLTFGHQLSYFLSGCIFMLGYSALCTFFSDPDDILHVLADNFSADPFLRSRL